MDDSSLLCVEGEGDVSNKTVADRLAGTLVLLLLCLPFIIIDRAVIVVSGFRCGLTMSAALCPLLRRPPISDDLQHLIIDPPDISTPQKLPRETPSPILSNGKT